MDKHAENLKLHFAVAFGMPLNLREAWNAWIDSVEHRLSMIEIVPVRAREEQAPAPVDQKAAVAANAQQPTKPVDKPAEQAKPADKPADKK